MESVRATKNTNCRVKRQLISTRTLEHGSPAETKPYSTILTQRVKMDYILGIWFIAELGNEIKYLVIWSSVSELWDQIKSFNDDGAVFRVFDGF